MTRKWSEESATHLEQDTLGLGSVESDVPNDKHPDKRSCHDTGASNQHSALANCVGLDDSLADGVTHRVAELSCQILVDSLPIGESLSRKVLLQCAG